jgi:hypothetical protein
VAPIEPTQVHYYVNVVHFVLCGVVLNVGLDIKFQTPGASEARCVILIRWCDRVHALVSKSPRFIIHAHNLPQKQERPFIFRLISHCSAEHQEEAVGFAEIEIKNIFERAVIKICPIFNIPPLFVIGVLLRNGRFNSPVLSRGKR